MTGVLYGGVQGFWVRKDIIITTFVLLLFTCGNDKTRHIIPDPTCFAG